MCALELLQLQTVLQQTQEFVRRSQVGGVVAADVSTRRQCSQCIDGALDMQRTVGAPVHQLQELDGEFDVAQTSAAEFEFTLTQFGGNHFLDASTHGLDFGDEVLALGGDPHHRAHRLGVLATELHVARHRTSLEQRLELPGLGPTLVVRDVGFERANQFSALTFGTQRSIDLEECGGSDTHHLTGNATGRRVGRFGDEHDVDVGDVVQFARTTFAHGDDCEPDRTTALRAHRCDGYRECSGQRSVSQVGKLMPHSLIRHHRFVLDGRRKISRGHKHQLILVALTQSNNSFRSGHGGAVGQ